MRGTMIKYADIAVHTRSLSVNMHGEEVASYAATSTVRGHLQPRSDNISSSALAELVIGGLQVVPYTHECWIVGASVLAQHNRLVYGGKTYEIEASKSWANHCHALLKEVV